MEGCTSSLISSTVYSILILSISFPFYGNIFAPILRMLNALALPALIKLYHPHSIPTSFFQRLSQCEVGYEMPIGGKTDEQERNRDEVKQQIAIFSDSYLAPLPFLFMAEQRVYIHNTKILPQLPRS